ncbi:MAG: outer membrane beta-barrel protein [Blastochloris sp.]|nr:outer membrane beta-barrel protein [Blastochloris sp.]
MNKWITSLFAVALTGSVAFADVAAPAIAAKDLEKVVDEAIYVETATKGVVLSGYVDAGYIYNFQAAAFGRTTADNQARGDFSLNAFKLTLQKALSDKNEFQAGFRADVKIGEDATNLTATGAGSSDTLSLDQAYVIVRAPIGNGLDITVGKFAALLGYEVDDRPANLNITHGYDYVFQSSHQTGVKFFYPVNDIIELQLAVTNGSGIDTNSGSLATSNLTDTNTDGYAVNATINIKAPGGNANWFNGVYASNGVADGFTNDESAFQWNSWGNWAPKFANDKLLLGFSTTLGDSARSEVGTENGYTYFTGSLYAKYQFTQIFSLAGRGSYLHSIDGAPLAVPSALNGDAYSFTLTAGFNLLENLLVRAEYRADIVDGAAGDENSDIANTIAVQAVYTF